MNPFASSGGIPNSPPIVSHKAYSYTDGMDPFAPSTAVANSPVGASTVSNMDGQVKSDLNPTFDPKSEDTLNEPAIEVKAETVNTLEVKSEDILNEPSVDLEAETSTIEEATDIKTANVTVS